MYEHFQDLFVPYDIAKAVEEKGFKENCMGFYATKHNDTYNFKPLEKPMVYPSVDDHKETAWIRKVMIDCQAPTWDQVINWFINKHKIHIGVIYMNSNDVHAINITVGTVKSQQHILIPLMCDALSTANVTAFKKALTLI